MIISRKLENTITGTVNGKPFNLPRTKEAEESLSSLDENATTEEVMEVVKSFRDLEIAGSNEYLLFNPVTKQYFLQYKDFRSKHPIPKSLVRYIEESFDKNIDFMPIVKAWARLLANPRYTESMGTYFGVYLDTVFIDYEAAEKLQEEENYTIAAAEAICTYKDIAITQEGLLATYKVAQQVTWEYIMEKQEDGSYVKVKKDKYEKVPAVINSVSGKVEKEGYNKSPEYKEDFIFTPAICTYGDDFYSGKDLGYIYEIGKTQYLPKNAKRNLNHGTGGGGLYIGGLQYVKGFRSFGTHVLTCFVNPGDILSFQSEGHAIRTDALFPNNVWEEEAPLKGKYHSSDYSKLSEERLAALVKEAVDEDVDIREEQLKNN